MAAFRFRTCVITHDTWIFYHCTKAITPGLGSIINRKCCLTRMWHAIWCAHKPLVVWAWEPVGRASFIASTSDYWKQSLGTLSCLLTSVSVGCCIFSILLASYRGSICVPKPLSARQFIKAVSMWIHWTKISAQAFQLCQKLYVLRILSYLIDYEIFTMYSTTKAFTVIRIFILIISWNEC